MPLHEWSDRPGWSGVHLLWIAELLRWIKPRLPAGYRAYVASAPTLEVAASPEKPDVAVREWLADKASASVRRGARKAALKPDEEFRVKVIAPRKAVYIERLGVLTAAVELVSPRNKDRAEARALYLNRYMSYLIEGANLLLIDVHRRPLRFSFADRINRQLGIRQESVPAPIAVAYRIGDPLERDFQPLAIWRRPLSVGQALPVMPLPLTVETSVPVDLEQTYTRAAADAYLA
ncbi:MAG TPA: DUF4058 family protein [Gemmataceae bacterium]|nr:DUF4058 family protein [Gemmataceae bacterium]